MPRGSRLVHASVRKCVYCARVASRDEEKKRILQMIFSEIRADHTVDGLKIEFRPKPIWEPYVEAVLARQRQDQAASPAVTTSERKTGLLRAARGPRVAINAEGNVVPLRHAA